MLRIDHETRFIYTEPVIESLIEIRMSPPSTEDQTVLGHKIRVLPQTSLVSFRDGNGNRAELFSILPAHSEIVIQASSCVRVHRRNPQHLLQSVIWPYAEPLFLDAAEFLRPGPLTTGGERVETFLKALPKLPGNLFETIEVLMQEVRARLSYSKQVTDVETPVEKALELSQGVCQDYAHLMIATCRSLGIPARYVSGYVHQPGEMATHAWCQIWGGTAAGWVDIDPTRGKWCGNDHILAAVGRDYSEVPPNKGVWRGAGAKETITVLVNVSPVDRVPTELTELSAPAWSSTSPDLSIQQMSGGFQNQKKVIYRQQQSQQQQFRSMADW